MDPRHKIYWYFGLASISIFYLFFKEIFLLVLLCLFNIVVSLFKKYFKQIPFEFELVTLTVFLFSRYGWIKAMLIGFSMLISILLIESRLSPYNLLKFAGIALAAYFSRNIGNNYLGFCILVICYNLSLIIAYHLLKMNPYHNLSHQLSNIAFNLWVYHKFMQFAIIT